MKPMRARYAVDLTNPDGSITELTRTRRLNGAQNELDAHVQSKRDQLKKHAFPGDKVASGPRLDGSTVVALMTRDGEVIQYRYSITELDGRRVP